MDNVNKHCILSTDQMDKVDQSSIDELKKLGKTGAELMEAAGLSVVRTITSDCNGQNVLVLCGPGNNGGDGFVVGHHLQKMSFNVEVALLCELADLKGDALTMANRWVGGVVPISPEILSGKDIIVDAIFGTGLSKEINGHLKETLEAANEIKAHKISIDIPSGVKGDTGEVLGVAFKADKTITFSRKKPAHLLYPGKALCGDILVAEIGVPDQIVNDIGPDIFCNNPELWNKFIPRFEGSIHKYQKGHAVVVSGNMIQTGASRMAAMAALRIGAGLVSVSSPEDALQTHAAHLTGIMIRRREQLTKDLQDDRLNVWCIGPAAGVNDITKKNVLKIVKSGRKVVLDADALTVFEGGPLELFEAINSTAKSECVLTPHAGEFARIFPYLKKLDKITAAKNAAKLSGAVLIYKGADTVIASPDGRCVISDNAMPTLATAGSGDVLAGILTGFLAQNMPVFEAACAAVWIHSECGKLFGEGLIAEDLPGLIPQVLEIVKSIK